MDVEELVLEGSPFSKYLDSISLEHNKVKINDHQLNNLINDNSNNSIPLEHNEEDRNYNDKVIRPMIHHYATIYKDLLEKSSLFVDGSPFYRNDEYIEFAKLNPIRSFKSNKSFSLSHIFITASIFVLFFYVYITLSELIALLLFIIISFVIIYLYKPITYLRFLLLHRNHNKNIKIIEQYISSCRKYKSIIKKGINIIQEVELVSRGYKLSSYLSPIARLEKNAKVKKSNVLREVILESLYSMTHALYNVNFSSFKTKSISLDLHHRDTSLISIKKYEKIVNEGLSNIITELLLSLGINNELKIDDKEILNSFKSIHSILDEISNHITQEYQKIYSVINNDNWIGKVDANEVIKKFKRIDECVTFDEQLNKLHNEIKTINALITLCKEDFVTMASSSETTFVTEQLNRLYSQFYKVKENLIKSLELWESSGNALYKLHESFSLEKQAKIEVDNVKKEELVTNFDEETNKDDEPLINNIPSNVLVIHEAEKLDVEPVKKTNLTREERIKQMKEKREKERKVKTTIEDRLSMIKELKDVLSHISNENVETVTIKHNFI